MANLYFYKYHPIPGSVIACNGSELFGPPSLEASLKTSSQPVSNDTSPNNASKGNQFIVNIRGISSITEKNMVALISTDNDVQAVPFIYGIHYFLPFLFILIPSRTLDFSHLLHLLLKFTPLLIPCCYFSQIYPTLSFALQP